jgi:uncharacterized cupredoxin-like copper-binding protein
MLINMSAFRNPRRHRTAVAAALVALPLVAACGSTSATSGGKNTVPANPSITITGTDNKFDAHAYTAKAGEVTFAYANKGNVSHSLLVKASDGTRMGDRLFLVPGKSAGLAVTLTPGVYELICDVPGHKESGMDATLTVS